MSEHTALPWAYRPQIGDDWGVIRSPAAADGFAHLVAVARPGRFLTEDEKDEHRRAKTDPHGPNAAFIVCACNSHDDLVKAIEGLIGEYSEGAKFSDRIKAAQAALAKARGEPS